MPIAAYCGVSISDFWTMSPKTLLIYKEAKDKEYQERSRVADLSAWMDGAYVLKAIGCVLSKDAKYPEKPIFFSEKSELSEEEIEEVINENTKIAAINFASWAKAANEKGR